MLGRMAAIASLTVNWFPPSGSDYPVGTASFNSGYDLKSIDDLDVFVGVGSGTTFYTVGKTDSGINPAGI